MMSRRRQRTAEIVELGFQSRDGCVALRQDSVEVLDPHRAATKLFHALVLDGPSLFGFALDPTLFNGEFCPQMILFGRELRDRHRKERLSPPPGECFPPAG